LQNAGLPCGMVLTVVKEFCGLFQIPAFMFASGYLFSKKPIGNYFKFEGRKLLNLGVPYIVFSAVYYFVNVSFSSSVNFTYTPKDLIGIYMTPLAQYWYIFATILIFLFLPVLELVISNEFILLAFLVTWKLINSYYISETNYDYFFSQYAYIFYLGVLYGRHHDAISLKDEKARTVIPIFVLCIGTFASKYFFDWSITITVIEMFIPLLTTYLLVYFFETFADKIENKFLSLVAKYSFQIYLLHTMVTAAMRIVMVKGGITNQWIQFVIGWSVGLSVTMFVAWFCERTEILNIFFFPERTVKKLRKK
jgi:fucose 4-O-acetylase-like acetyltransferase